MLDLLALLLFAGMGYICRGRRAVSESEGHIPLLRRRLGRKRFGGYSPLMSDRIR